MSALKAEMNTAAEGAAAKVLKDHWERNKNLVAQVKKLVSKNGAYFQSAPIANSSEHGVELTFRVDKAIRLKVTLTEDSHYSFTSVGGKKYPALNYETQASTGNSAIGYLHQWIANVGIARDEDIQDKIQKADYKEPAPAPMRRSAES